MSATVVAKLTQILWKKGWLQLLLEKANNLNKKMDPTITGIKHSNLQREKYFLGTTATWINEIFYNLLFNIFGYILFQVLSIYRLGELSFELSLIKGQRRDEALSEFIQNSRRFSQIHFLNSWLEVHINLIFHERGSMHKL